MSRPLVSVFMPAYNQVEFVAEALQSAIDQDYPNLQVVAGDDGSIDGTADIIKDYARRYPDRVTAIVDVPHIGLTPNCNRTLRACKGEYVAFHAGDDVYLPGKISAQVEWFEADDRRVLCGHDVEVFDSRTGEPISISKATRQGRGAAAVIRHNNLFTNLSNMVRASSIPAGGYSERLTIASDWQFFMECLVGGGSYGFVEGVYARYRRNAGSISELWLSDPAVRVRWLEDNFTTLAWVESHHPEYVSSCFYNKARRLLIEGKMLLLEQGDIGQGRRYLMNSLRYRLNWRTACWLVLACAPLRVRRAVVDIVPQRSIM